MKVAVSLPLLCVFACAAAEPAQVVAKIGADYVSPPSVPTQFYLDASKLPPLRDWQPGDPLREIPRLLHESEVPHGPRAQVGIDPLADLQSKFTDYATGRAFSDPLLSVNGQGNTGVSPPDTTGDIGPDHYLQSINGSAGARYAIYAKATGALVAGPFAMNSLGSGGVCASSLGDPVVIYDELAERWVITEFTNSTGRGLCFYISAGSNPVATTWTRYSFVMPAFPDYPHYGVWPDAYYVAANESGTAGQRPVYAMDRLKMLAGQPATFQRFTLPRLAGFGFQAWQPADHSGKLAPPPAGAPGIFMRHRDDEAHNAGAANATRDFLEISQLKIDFTTPTNSVLSPVVQIPITEIDSNLNGLSAFEAFPQPNGVRLDPLREQVMQRLAYRNFGSYEALAGSLVTDVDGADTGGVRWFELRRTGGITNPWTLHQEGTYSLADGGGPRIDRWMSSIQLDKAGNIGLAYSVVRDNPAVFAGMRYVGRLVGDPLNVMTTAEGSIIEGGGSQGGTNTRWGDYSDLSTDPVDGCTFWFTSEYLATASWNTRLGSFRHASCLAPEFTFTAPTTPVQVCANSPTPTVVPPQALSVGVINGFADPVSLNAVLPLPTGVLATLNPPVVTPPGTSNLQVTVNNTATPGLNQVRVRASAGALEHFADLNFNVTTALPAVATLASPADTLNSAGLTPLLRWNAVAGATGYRVEISRAASFSDFVVSELVTTTSYRAPTLRTGQRYFWRVKANNFCGDAAASVVRSFNAGVAGTVPAQACVLPALAIPDNNATGISADNTPTTAVTVTDLDLVVRATHTAIGQLRLSLEHPGSGASVLLKGLTSCTADNVDVSLNDEAATLAEATCLTTAGAALRGDVRPTESLGLADGLALNSAWRLKVVDTGAGDTGTLTEWCLKPTAVSVANTGEFLLSDGAEN